MKIALVSEHASPLATLGGVDAGGQNVHVAGLARALAERGHEVTVYTRHDSDEQPSRVGMAPGVTVEHVPAGPARPVGRDRLLPYMGQFGGYLERRWAADPPDVVHAHYWMSGIAAHVAARGVGLPVVQTFHALGSVKRRYLGSEDPSPSGRIRMEAALGRAAAAVIATASDEVAELGRLGVSRHSISVVPCGTDLERFRPEGPTHPRADRPRLICVGRPVERKGVDTVVRALRRVPDAELLVVGGPPPGELEASAEIRRLRAVAREVGVADRVEFVGGVGRGTVASLLRSADVAVSVPWYEPFGLVVVEAMACGTPVVASAVGGHLDTIVDNTTGVLVPPRDPMVLARRIRSLLADPLRRAAFGVAGADRAGCRYSWDRVVGETLSVYERVQPEKRGKVAAAGGAA
ncbi:MAG: glycosyltransferase [Streptosporangiales bacterium]|nr:glycosyltransferase [Streptosporangiales bacterium]